MRACKAVQQSSVSSDESQFYIRQVMMRACRLVQPSSPLDARRGGFVPFNFQPLSSNIAPSVMAMVIKDCRTGCGCGSPQLVWQSAFYYEYAPAITQCGH